MQNSPLFKSDPGGLEEVSTAKPKPTVPGSTSDGPTYSQTYGGSDKKTLIFTRFAYRNGTVVMINHEDKTTYIIYPDKQVIASKELPEVIPLKPPKPPGTKPSLVENDLVEVKAVPKTDPDGRREGMEFEVNQGGDGSVKIEINQENAVEQVNVAVVVQKKPEVPKYQPLPPDFKLKIKPTGGGGKRP